jgi:hypothetical protein
MLFFLLSLISLGTFCAAENVFFTVDHGAVSRKSARFH